MTFPQAPALPEELDKLMRRMRLPDAQSRPGYCPSPNAGTPPRCCGC